jgi:hypothetical protein
MKANQELNQLINYKNMINFIREQRFSWLGHVDLMPTNRSVKSLYSWKSLSTRPVGRPQIRWEEDVKADIKRIMVPDWKIRVEDGVVEKTKTLREL